jgi:hypothetical protein
LARFSENARTAPALKKWTSPLHRKKRDEEKGQIVIHSFQLGLVKTALGTHPWGSVKLDGPRLNACNEKKHGLLPSTPTWFFFAESLVFSFPLSIGN